MSDLISRKAVLDKFNAICENCGEDKKYNGIMCGSCALDDAISIIENMPTAERVVKVRSHGVGTAWSVCECGQGVNLGWSYCPFCGGRIERK